MPEFFAYQNVLFAIDWAIRIGVAARVIMTRREVAASLAWIGFTAFIPILGLALYLLIGEQRVGAKRRLMYERVSQGLERKAAIFWRGGPEEENWTDECNPYKQIATLCTATAEMPALRGNTVRLIGDAEEYINLLIEDVEAARSYVHMCYYIWMAGGDGDRVADALIRAAARGVDVRVLVDAVGAKPFLRTDTPDRMKAGGVNVAVALPTSIAHLAVGRLDLRNHRKLAVIDARIAYTGSQNLTSATYAVRDSGVVVFDASVRLEGPAAQALEVVFLRDWHLDHPEEAWLEKFLPRFPIPDKGSIVHVVPSGPGQAPKAIHRALLTTIHMAREELIMTTPYFVPDEPMLAALESAALRGVQVTVVVPGKSDTILVPPASRAFYPDLLRAGVRIMEFHPGLLHAKTVTVDGAVAVIGSANFDVRSFLLNLELTLFVYDDDVASMLRFLQVRYMDQSDEIFLDDWLKRPLRKRIVENTMRLLSPLL